MAHPSSTPARRHSFLGAAFFSLLSIALLQQTLVLQEPGVSAFVLKTVHASSSSSEHSLSTIEKRLLERKMMASSSLHTAAPVLSKRRRSTGALVIQHTSSVARTVIKAGCGDGLITEKEECDDKNAVGGDGCSAACIVEGGFSCSSNQPSTCWSTCGDNVTAANEKCDDGNTVSGDGCSSTCKAEFGYICKGSPSTCAIPSYCGNGVVETGETCDDGNFHSGDGCYLCKAE